MKRSHDMVNRKLSYIESDFEPTTTAISRRRKPVSKIIENKNERLQFLLWIIDKSFSPLFKQVKNRDTVIKVRNKRRNRRSGQGLNDSPVKAERGTLFDNISGLSSTGSPCKQKNNLIVKLNGTPARITTHCHNKQGGIVNNVPNYSGIEESLDWIVRFKNFTKNMTKKSAILLNRSNKNDNQKILENEQRLVTFLLHYVKAWSGDKNYALPKIEDYKKINPNLMQCNNTRFLQMQLNNINRTIFTMFSFECSRRQRYNADTNNTVLSSEGVMISNALILKLLKKRKISFNDAFSQDSKYNIVTGKSIKADDPELSNKFLRLFKLYSIYKYDNKDKVPASEMIYKKMVQKYYHHNLKL